MNAPYSRDLHSTLRKVGMGVLSSVSILLAGCPLHHGGTGGGGSIPPPGPIAVTTYHYDNLRSGWNPKESILNYSNVNASSLSVKVLQLDSVNDQVDTQPLIVPNISIAGNTHDVVYVATEGNNVYAFDANTGDRLKMVNLGDPVPMPNGCVNNGPTVGIDGTPVIDLPNSTMYVITYNVESGNPVYYIHALDLATLTDKQKRLITASQKLADGTTFAFNPQWHRQRPGLLLGSGNIYAAFGSFCDSVSDQSRGWVLGWQTGSLTPLPATLLTDTRSSEPHGMFLSTVWMSGWAIAGDQNGNLYFSTGNSDYDGTTYSQDNNTSNSILRLNPDLTRPSPTSKFLFTPSNVGAMDTQDLDMSAGGVMLVPPQSPPAPLDIAVATGKDGRMFLLNRDNLGGFTPTDTGALSWVSIGNRCWCGPTYFNDGTPHLVSSGGTSASLTSGANPGISQNSLQLWGLQISPKPLLTQSASGSMPDTNQDPGFFTVVSSNGTKNAIIWAVSRPLASSKTPGIWLFAFKATPSGNMLPGLFKSIAGSWPYGTGNANIMPVVANGKVYVASYKELDIFGLNLSSAQGAQKVKARVMAAQAPTPELVRGPEEHRLSGFVRRIEGDRLTIETRDNKTVEVDATDAKKSYRYYMIAVGMSVHVAGSYDSNGVLRAAYVWRAKPGKSAWPPDR